MKKPSSKNRLGLEAKVAQYTALAGAAAATVPAAGAAVVHVTGSPVIVGQNGFATWNIDGAGGSEFSFAQSFLQTFNGGTPTYVCTGSEGFGCTEGYTTVLPVTTVTLFNNLGFNGTEYAGFMTENSANSIVDIGDGFDQFGSITNFSSPVSPFVLGQQIVGFQFGGPGAVKNGWANITVGPQSLEITEWAYQTSGGPIAKGQTIPEPSSLALLAAGAAGFGLYRRRRQESQAAE